MKIFIKKYIVSSRWIKMCILSTSKMPEALPVLHRGLYLVI